MRHRKFNLVPHVKQGNLLPADQARPDFVCRYRMHLRLLRLSARDVPGHGMLKRTRKRVGKSNLSPHFYPNDWH
jgi:hypothetical protein